MTINQEIERYLTRNAKILTAEEMWREGIARIKAQLERREQAKCTQKHN